MVRGVPGPGGDLPVIDGENLDIGNARPPLQYTGDDGAVHGYIANAAAIHVEKGRHITVRNCILRDAGNGLFVATSGGITEDAMKL